MDLHSLAGYETVRWTENDKAALAKQLEPFFSFLPRTLSAMLIRQIRLHPLNSGNQPCEGKETATFSDESSQDHAKTARAETAHRPESERGGTRDVAQGPPPYRLSITIEGARIVAMAFGVELRDAYLFCMANGLWPLRFIRNAGTLTLQEQEYLLRSRVAIVGCGALGGYVSLLLARIGIGSLVLCDDDIFEETNLNRQLFCLEKNLGQHKVDVAQEHLLNVASHLLITTFAERATIDSLPYMLTGAHALVDCVDTVSARIVMDEVAVSLGIPYIHGAVGGFEGFCGVSFVDEGVGLVRSLYGKDASLKDDEDFLAEVGLFASTPSLVASLQALFTVQTLLARFANQPVPAKKLVHLDLAVPSLELLNV